MAEAVMGGLDQAQIIDRMAVRSGQEMEEGGMARATPNIYLSKVSRRLGADEASPGNARLNTNHH